MAEVSVHRSVVAQAKHEAGIQVLRSREILDLSRREILAVRICIEATKKVIARSKMLLDGQLGTIP